MHKGRIEQAHQVLFGTSFGRQARLQLERPRKVIKFLLKRDHLEKQLLTPVNDLLILTSLSRVKEGLRKRLKKNLFLQKMKK